MHYGKGISLLTDTCKNITFLQTSDVGGKIHIGRMLIFFLRSKNRKLNERNCTDTIIQCEV